MTEDPISVCPACGGETRRLISGGAGFILKGSGFYKTDYRSKSYSADASKDKPADPAKKDKSGSGEKSDSSGSGKASPGKTGKSD